MPVNNPVNIQIGELNVSVTMDNGEVVRLTAEDHDGNTFDVGFVLEQTPINGIPCQICRYVNGRKVCWDVECSLIRPPDDYANEV